MQSIAESLATRDVGTLRFNFPYMEAGGRRTDPKPVCVETIANAVALARSRFPQIPLFAGGHSFGGRMTSHCAAEGRIDVAGLVYYSFPLHPSGKPGVARAAHLDKVSVPQLFLTGTRDTLAELELLRGVVKALPHASLHELDTADHGFHILKRSRRVATNVYDEAANVVATFVRDAADHG